MHSLLTQHRQGRRWQLGKVHVALRRPSPRARCVMLLAYASPSVEAKGGGHGFQPDPSVADAGMGMTTDEVGVRKSIPVPMLSVESDKQMVARSSQHLTGAREDVEGETKTDKKVPDASIGGPRKPRCC
jgi:hypothetical protein